MPSLHLSAPGGRPCSAVAATHRSTEPQALRSLFADIQSTRARCPRMGQKRGTPLVLDAGTKAEVYSTSINRLPIEILSKVFELASESREGSIVLLSHVCRCWRAVALASPRAWSKLSADLSAPKAEQALAYLERSGACPLDVRLIASTGQLPDPSSGMVPGLHSSLARWRSFSLQSDSPWVCSEFVKSLSGWAPVLEEFSLEFQPTGRTHGDQPQLPPNFSVHAPSLRVLRLDNFGVDLEWAATLRRLHTLELIQSTENPLPYDALLRALSNCASSLCSIKIHARISSGPQVLDAFDPVPLVFPRLETLDLTLQTSSVSSLLIDVEAPNLRSLSIHDIGSSADGWCSLGIRSFLRHPALQLCRLRLHSSGLNDEELVWALKRTPKLDTLEMINLNNTDTILRALSTPAPSAPPADAETWITPMLGAVIIEQCHQITGSALVDSIKERNTRSVDSNSHTPVRTLRVQNCHHFERRHSIKLNKLTPELQLDAKILSFTFGLGGIRVRSPHQNQLGFPLS